MNLRSIIDFLKSLGLGSKNGFAGSATKILILSIDLFFALFAFAFAVFVDRTLNATSWTLVMTSSLPWILLTLRGISFIVFKTYLIIIRFVGEKDIFNLFWATTTSSLAFYFLLKAFPLALPGDRAATVVVVDYLLLLYLSGGFRAFLRLLYKYLRRQNKGKTIPTIIYGAGELGAITLRILEQSPAHNYQVVAFLDDNPKVRSKLLNGIPIYDPQYSLDSIIKQWEVKTAIIAIQKLPDYRRIFFIDTCLEHQVEVLKVPTTNQWINNELSTKQLKKVKVKDLLNREAIQLNPEMISDQIKGQKVLVTGCAGSIGSEIVRQILQFDPESIIGVDQAETPLVNLVRELKDDRLVPLVADVRDAGKMERIFAKYRPKYVFHAAAYKHVPIMEFHPEEAVKTNIAGSMNVARAAAQVGVKKFVMVSTDKVINPTNVMGASKRVAEIFMQQMQTDSSIDTQFIVTRFGNVLGSNGSVVPVFQKQIEARKPVTVTHREVTRYFMTIPEACQLVLEAGVMGNGGEIFVFDMGQPIKIYDLARRLIQLSGFKPDIDIPIHITGLRPGEKLYEELLSDRENTKKTHHPKIMIAEVNHERSENKQNDIIALIQHCSVSEDRAEILKYLEVLVPEYHCQTQNLSVETPPGPRRKSTKETADPTNSAERAEPLPQKNEPPKKEYSTDLKELKGQSGVKKLFLNTVGRMIPTDMFSPRHAISVKAICFIDHKVILLKTELGHWDLPGGKLRKREHWRDCIHREVQEELNVKVHDCKLISLRSARIRDTSDVLITLVYCQIDEFSPNIQLSQEHYGVQLFQMDEIDDLKMIVPYQKFIKEVYYSKREKNRQE
jgi:FlaA1/EpsC-like NDP-sugar epimerase/ADP-ribose pyrophosphatase YjhB (NUDIX family)